MNKIIVSMLGYLLGSIPFALVIGKLFYQTDVRNQGSGNLGATNAGRVLGKKVGITVAILDVFKAFVAMLIVYPFAPELVIFPGFFATIGHIFPVFAHFKGGKAVSTSFGFLLGISLFITQHTFFHFFIPLAIFFIVLSISKMVSLSSMIAITSASIILALSDTSLQVKFAFIIVNLIVIYRHRTNIERIIAGNENKVTWI